ncbi:MAG: TRAP transporter small permease subunit [SAR324 cluster bacterium]|nr:TRAP transporter small permease subunit [SAR324 cluster bacterium]MBL7035239.1 TRAP transporter small permease subunit [SAR324 cluster bacterium]
MIAYSLLFLVNDYLIFVKGWPGPLNFLKHQEWFGFSALRKPLEENFVFLGWAQFLALFAVMVFVSVWASKTQKRSLRDDARLWARFAAYIVRSAFWAVLLIGIVDVTISFLRVENFLEVLVGDELALALGRPSFRGTFVLYPLFLIGAIIAYFSRGLGFIWLSVMVVVAEFLIVITRFVFSYEQAFMGDLVRFWYAALFLFASAYGMVSEGHVRVDVLYAALSKRSKAISNTVGSIILGMPLCWVILLTGMWSQGSSLNGPLLSFEIYQQGYGMYVKFLMVGFMIIFALSMLVQFVSYTLDNIANLQQEPGEALPEEAQI